MSQDESKIVQITEEVEVQTNTIQCRINNHWTNIGTFKTEERAKEVLGRIFGAIQNGGFSYKMPREV